MSFSYRRVMPLKAVMWFLAATTMMTNALAFPVASWRTARGSWGVVRPGMLPYSAAHRQHHTALWARKKKKPNTNRPPAPSLENDGTIGSGPNWIERSFPVSTTDDGDEKNAAIDYDLGLHGPSFQVGALSQRLYDLFTNRPGQIVTPETSEGYKLCAMELAAKEAVRVALEQQGLELTLTTEQEEMEHWYASVDSITLHDDSNATPQSFDSWQDAAPHWTVGQDFSFCVRQVPAKQKSLSVQDILQALDPDGSLRAQAQQAGMDVPAAVQPDDDEQVPEFVFQSLADLAQDTVRRTEAAPRPAVDEQDAYAGDLEQRGYQIVSAPALKQALEPSARDDAVESASSRNRQQQLQQHSPMVMHVMEALVSHGCVVVDVDDPASVMAMAGMWKAAQDFFDDDNTAVAGLEQGMRTAPNAGSRHAKVGYAIYENDSLRFLETRLDRNGTLQPDQARAALGTDACQSLRDAFGVVADIGKDIVRMTVSASSVEVGALDRVEALDAAEKLANELMDDGRPLPADCEIEHSEGGVSMSPHRLCRYANNSGNTTSSSSREIFGAHTDSSFVTAVPVAAVAGLEVYDEGAEQWYRPEKAARKWWQAQQQAAGKDPESLVETVNGVELPWHARYVVCMPGEMLQIATRNEIPAAVHRVVATQGTTPRLSAPILLRGRTGLKFDIARYFKGNAMGDPLLEECSGKTIEDMHDAMQPSFQ